MFDLAGQTKIDTHVVLAGLLTARADSPMVRVLDGILSASFSFVLSERLLAEYRAVLLRPHLQKLHGLSVAEVDTVLLDIAHHAIVLNPMPATDQPKAPDPGDQFLWNLLGCRSDMSLVTGDKLLLQDAAMQQRVISAAVWVAQLWP